VLKSFSSTSEQRRALRSKREARIKRQERSKTSRLITSRLLMKGLLQLAFIFSNITV